MQTVSHIADKAFGVNIDVEKRPMAAKRECDLRLEFKMPIDQSCNRKIGDDVTIINENAVVLRD